MAKSPSQRTRKPAPRAEALPVGTPILSAAEIDISALRDRLLALKAKAPNTATFHRESAEIVHACLQGEKRANLELAAWREAMALLP